jgi:chromosome segregation ATPase
VSDDDRQQRDELEKVQSEVLRLRRALEKPTTLHADVRARIDSLRKSRAQQQQRLDEAKAKMLELEEELRRAREETSALQVELDSISGTERSLVDAAVSRLDPGPRAGTGCLTALVALLVIAAVLF